LRISDIGMWGIGMPNLTEIAEFIQVLVPECRTINLNKDLSRKIIIQKVFSDSRKVENDSLFCCISGGNFNGHEFIKDAELKGASCVLSEYVLDSDLPQIIVPSVRSITGYIASYIYGNPSDYLTMIAVTGTNGKSTTTYMLRNLLENAGLKTGLMGTITYHDGIQEMHAGRTTPEATDIQQWLFRMRENGCTACVMETSSHGLKLGRLNGCRFDIGIFTNLTAEHLDFHGNIDNYFEAKKLLFKNYMKEKWNAIFNIDDDYGNRLYSSYIDHATTFSINNNSADVHPESISLNSEGFTVDLQLPGYKYIKALKSSFTGRYNVYNALAAVSAAYLMGLSCEVIRSGLMNMPKVPGRSEKYLFDNGVCCVIDYAHTPDALENILRTLSEIKQGRLKIVFGLGGNRYSENRPIMGNIASRYADDIYITMDNPRDEEPSTIAEQIYQGVKQQKRQLNCTTILDRKSAVFQALDDSVSGDIILVSGKGPETSIIWAGERIPYNDLETILLWARMKGMGWR